MKILLVEDDPHISTFLEKGLREEGYRVDTTSQGDDALYLCDMHAYDLLIVDVMLPKVSGLEVCQTLREKGFCRPIILLSARDTTQDKINGLDQGANDYITKPFAFDELLARVRVQLRDEFQHSDKFQFHDFTIDFTTKEVYRNETLIRLTKKEFDVLRFLVQHHKQIVSEEMILDALDSMEESTVSNVVSVYIYRLRNKLDKGYAIALIHTYRGLGYKFGLRED